MIGRLSLRAPSVRVLGNADVAAALQLCARRPIENAFVAARLQACIAGLYGGDVWGYYDGGELTSLLWVGSNMVPVAATPDALDAFAAKVKRSSRTSSSIVGPRDMVLPLWNRLQGSWGPSREVRVDQPLLAISQPPAVAADPAVRQANISELETFFPASVAMFVEEVGYSPTLVDGGGSYRNHVAAMLRQGYCMVRMVPSDRGEKVLFKADVGAVGCGVAQLQGVWVDPAYRGLGVAAPAMASVVRMCQQHLAPTASLYVNAYNTRAIHIYQRVGFRQASTFATVIF